MSYQIPHVTDHVARALVRLAQQFSREGGVAKMVRLLAGRSQSLEDALYAFLEADAISTAVGSQLDVLGALVGQARAGHDDVGYRLRIRIRIVVNRSSGTAPELIRIAKLLLEGAEVHFASYFPAGYTLTAIEPTTIGNELATLLLEATMGGVRGLISWTEVPLNQTLTLNSSTPGTRLNEGALAHGRSN